MSETDKHSADSNSTDTDLPASDPLESLRDLLSSSSLPPVQSWHPTSTRDIDMRIARNGEWFYNGSVIPRARMVKLFSTVLRVDEDGETYLVTPQERLRIVVEDAPFTVVLLHKEGEGKTQGLVLTTNTGDKVLAGAQNPITVEYTRPNGEPSPYIVVRHKLRALISRSVFIELAELAQPEHAHHEYALKKNDADVVVNEVGDVEVNGVADVVGVYSDGHFMPLAQH